MRNLKKFLALALAVMMTLSLMVTANAITTNAAVTDKDSITDEFKEAVAVLNGLGIITGYEDGTFRPDKPISRQETTALVYRLHSGDVKDTKNDLYSTADNIKQFTDVKADGGQKWSAGYIGYCANQGIIKGVSDTRFAPTHEVTGYQVLAMVLRAIGYGQNKEYEGSGWQTRVASSATNLGLLKNVTNTNYSATLSAPATRELVAEIIFQAALQDTVTYTAGLGYVKTGSGLAGGTNGSLSKKNFDLKSGDYQVIDGWGRPGYKWYSGSTAIATITATPAKEYDTTQRECDVAHDLGIETSATYRLFVNSAKATTDSYRIEATDTVTKVGGQGRITEFYAKLTNPHNGSTWPASVVMIDTYLAKVTGVTAPVLDKAGHVIVKAKLNLEVYDGAMSYDAQPNGIGTNNPLDSTAANRYQEGKFPSKHVAEQDEAYEWSVGDMLLVQGYTDYSQYNDNNGPDTDNDGDVDSDDTPVTTNTNTGLNHLTTNPADLEKTAYETNVLKYKSTEAKINIVGKADMKLGKQTKTYWNTDKHNVDSTDYNDQMTLFLDRAKTDTNVTWAWYFDTKGNLIGIDEAPSNIQYGVITSLYSAFNQGDSYTDGTTKAIANVLMADGTTQTITIDRFLMGSAATAGGRYTMSNAGDGKQMLDVTGAPTTGDNIELIPQYDYESADDNVMKAQDVTTGTAHNAKQKGNLYVAPVTSINELKENGDSTPWSTGTNNSHYGIIRGNMFKFVNTQYGMTAVEVAGKYDANHNNENTGIYEWMYHDLAVTADNPKLTKSLGILKVNASKTVTVSNSTKIMVRSSDDLKVINTYDGLSKLPGDVTIAGGTEVDWVDFNGDGRVDYVYLTGRVSGTTTYGLFYYNGGAATWFGTEKKGEIEGWLNGEPTTVTFNDQDEFNLIKNHTSNVESLNYRAHLFALQIMNGVVSDVMYNQDTTAGAYLLADSPNAPEIAANTNTISSGKLTQDGTNPQTTTIKTSNAADMFGLGGLSAKWGNPYDADTGIVYHKDANLTAANTVKYVPGNSTVVVDTTTYYVTENSKIIGLGRGVSYGKNVLYYLNECDNDVTIVYDESMTGYKVIREIFVATDPDWTPGGVSNGVTFGGDIQVAPASANDNTKLTAWLKGFRTGVFRSDTTTMGTTGATKATMLYFPFVTSADNMTGTLEIKDNNGDILYVESAPIAKAGNHIFSFDFANAVIGGTSTGGWTGSVGLTAPGTYSYAIYVNGTSIVSSGTFTLIAK